MKVAKPQAFNGVIEKMSGFVMAYKLFLRM